MAMNLDFGKCLQPEMLGCQNSEDEEEASVYDRRLPSKHKKVERVVGYPTDWTRFSSIFIKSTP
jgi:hypothetical protein